MKARVANDPQERSTLPIGRREVNAGCDLTI
jgi:hypothetical protein